MYDTILGPSIDKDCLCVGFIGVGAISLCWQNISQTCYLVTLASVCEEMRNAVKNFFAFKGAPFIVNLISTENFLNNSRLNDLLAKEVSRNLQKVPTRIMCLGQNLLRQIQSQLIVASSRYMA